jgi:hypothetical protein
MIEAEIGHYTIDPGIEGTLEPEASQVDVGSQERLLVDVLAILLRTREMYGKAENRAVILPHQFFEGVGVSSLGLSDEQSVVHPSGAACCRMLASNLDGPLQFFLP